MAPKRKRAPSPDPNGMFRGMVVFLVQKGVQSRRLQVWKEKLIQKGAVIEESPSKKVTHIFAMNSDQVLHEVNPEQLNRFRGFEEMKKSDKDSNRTSPESRESRASSDVLVHHKNVRKPSEDSEDCSEVGTKKAHSESTGVEHQLVSVQSGPEDANASSGSQVSLEAEIGAAEQSSPYHPPDFNRNITEIFGKLINIYRALGDDRRSFSYYKAIPVIEKLPFRIESVDQVKHLPAIGKSLQDHINEIVATGKLSKLEHFENDEKVRTVSLFGEVWGIGPATALKLYEKGYRTLDDLKKDDSLTNAQRIGLRFFDDIKKRIPRHEVKDMEVLLKKAAQDVLPGVIVVCGGSYRRGKASCGDLDIIITHPDGESHKGFLPRYVQYLKDTNFLREELVFSTHSTEGTDSGVDTYFGLCTYPGRELRHRIDFKVYPRNRYAFGLIAWTGNDVLNRRLRLLAESKGYRLDDTGLYLAHQGSSGKRGVKSGTLVNCNTEKDVFDVLGFPWLEPHERNL